MTGEPKEPRIGQTDTDGRDGELAIGSREELLRMIDWQRGTIAAQQEVIARQQAIIRELESATIQLERRVCELETCRWP